MANSNSAYITKQPNSVNPSDWINKQEQIGLMYDEIARDKEREKQQGIDSETSKNLSNKLSFTDTGNGTTNRILSEVGLGMLSAYSETQEEAKNALIKHGVNSEQYRTALRKVKNMEGQPDVIALKLSEMADALNNETTQLATGNYIQNPDDIKKRHDFSKLSLTGKVNANGVPIIDVDGKEESIDAVIERLRSSGLTEKLDVPALVQDVGQKWKKREFQNRKGYTTFTKTNSWEDFKNPENGKMEKGAKSLLNDYYDDVLTEDEVNRYYATKGEHGYNSMPEETKKTLRENAIADLAENTKIFIEESSSEKFDTPKYNKDASLSASRNKDSGGGNVFEELSKNKIRPTEDVYGNEFKIDSSSVYSISPSKRQKIGSRTVEVKPKFNTIKDIETGDSFTNPTIESYTYDEDNNLIARITYVSDKGGKGGNDNTTFSPDSSGETDSVTNSPETREEAIIKANAEVERDIADFLKISIDELRSLAIDEVKLPDL